MKIRYKILMASIVISAYIFLWSIQAAWISVTPMVSDPTYYEAKAVYLFILSTISLSVGLVMFILIKK